MDITTEPLGTDPDGAPVYLRDIWPTPAGDRAHDRRRCHRPGDVRRRATPTCSRATSRWQSLPTPDRATRSSGTPSSTYVRKPPYFDGMPTRAAAGAATSPALACWPSSATRSPPTTSARPAPSSPTRPAGRYLTEHGVERARLQLLRLPPRQPRGDDPRHVRQHPAAQPARSTASRAASPSTSSPDGQQTTIYDASVSLPGGRRAARGPRRQGVRLGLLARLGGQGHRAARGQGRHRGVLRAHPPLEPDRHGRAAAAVPRGPERRRPRAHG